MKGFKNPSGDLPAAISSALSSAMVLAKIGDEADVPETPSSAPPRMIARFSPWAEMSGYPRPDYMRSETGWKSMKGHTALNKLAFVDPRSATYPGTADAW